MKTILAVSLLAFTFAGQAATPIVVHGDSPVHGRLILKNKGRAEISELTLTRCDRKKITYDILDEGKKINVGDETSLNLSAGCWNVELSGGGYEATPKQITIKEDQELVLNYR